MLLPTRDVGFAGVLPSPQIRTGIDDINCSIAHIIRQPAELRLHCGKCKPENQSFVFILQRVIEFRGEAIAGLGHTEAVSYEVRENISHVCREIIGEDCGAPCSRNSLSESWGYARATCGCSIQAGFRP